MDIRRLESSIEAGFVRWCNANGWRAEKLIGPKGWPDRTILGPGGQVGFVEFKRPGGKLSPIQKLTIAGLRKSGHAVAVCDSVASAVLFAKSL